MVYSIKTTKNDNNKINNIYNTKTAPINKRKHNISNNQIVINNIKNTENNNIINNNRVSNKNIHNSNISLNSVINNNTIISPNNNLNDYRTTYKNIQISRSKYISDEVIKNKNSNNNAQKKETNYKYQYNINNNNSKNENNKNLYYKIDDFKINGPLENNGTYTSVYTKKSSDKEKKINNFGFELNNIIAQQNNNNGFTISKANQSTRAITSTNFNFIGSNNYNKDTIKKEEPKEESDMEKDINFDIQKQPKIIDTYIENEQNEGKESENEQEEEPEENNIQINKNDEEEEEEYEKEDDLKNEYEIGHQEEQDIIRETEHEEPES